MLLFQLPISVKVRDERLKLRLFSGFFRSQLLQHYEVGQFAQTGDFLFDPFHGLFQSLYRFFIFVYLIR